LFFSFLRLIIFTQLMLLKHLTRHARPIGLASKARRYHDAKATLFNPDPGAGPVTKEVDIKISDPDEAYVTFSPEIGGVLASRPLLDGATIEVPLTFFHQTKHFARGNYALLLLCTPFLICLEDLRLNVLASNFLWIFRAQRLRIRVQQLSSISACCLELR
jgi:hypothetical protein